MDTNELKKLVAQHFDYATPGTGQYLHGDWFTPKHKDALHDLLDAITSDFEEKISDLEKEIDSLETENGSLTLTIKELQNEEAALA